MDAPAIEYLTALQAATEAEHRAAMRALQEGLAFDRHGVAFAALSSRAAEEIEAEALRLCAIWDAGGDLGACAHEAVYGLVAAQGAIVERIQAIEDRRIGLMADARRMH